MFEKNEQCWLLLGKRWNKFWQGTKFYQGKGTPTRVNFDGSFVLEREETEGDVLGFYHTHPNLSNYPSSIDDETMHGWVSCFGRPLLCAIKGSNGLKFWLYFDDESRPRAVKHIRLGKRFCGVY